MVLRRTYRIIAGILLGIVFLSAGACEKDFFVIVNCDECYSDEPQSATVSIKVRDSHLSTGRVTLNVYEGDNSDGPLIYSYYLSWNNLSVDVALNRSYTFEAIYSDELNTWRVIDAVRPSVKYSKENCDEPCYYVYNNSVDLRLKYE